MSHCCKPESNCVCCNKTRVKAPWDNCLDACGKDISANKLCKKPEPDLPVAIIIAIFSFFTCSKCFT